MRRVHNPGRAAAVLAGVITMAGLLVTAQTAQAGTTDVRSDVLTYTNRERAAHGCGPLVRNAALDRAAQGHASDMASYNYFSHSSRDGRSPFDRIRQAGYPSDTGRAENIAAGQPTAQRVVQGWMNSAGHRANILNCSYRSIGVGYGYGGGTTYKHYWVQNFGTR
ncbi:CAP domain-containing protein [Kribbella sp. NPDC056861]|uniref:CAP domain-containing protein n=1 Tax=Kribbella sp. NPDC056861 TaxID=3154857 RepID=UPI0034393CBC